MEGHDTDEDDPLRQAAVSPLSAYPTSPPPAVSSPQLLAEQDDAITGGYETSSQPSDEEMADSFGASDDDLEGLAQQIARARTRKTEAKASTPALLAAKEVVGKSTTPQEQVVSSYFRERQRAKQEERLD